MNQEKFKSYKQAFDAGRRSTNQEKTILYKQAWDVFKKSSDYERAEKAMVQNGIGYPYNENILRIGFDAGFNSK